MTETTRSRFPFRLLTGALLGGTLALPGCVYADFKTTLDTDLHATKLGAKTGESSTQSVLWLVAWGDSGTKAAAENGGITTINHADAKVFSILWGLYSKVTTVVYGD